MKMWYKLDEVIENKIILSNNKKCIIIDNEKYKNKYLCEYQKIKIDLEDKKDSQTSYYEILGAK